MFPNKMAAKPAAGKKPAFTKDQVAKDTERDLLGKPQQFGAAMPDDDPGAGNMGKPGGKHPKTEPEGGEMPNDISKEVPDQAEQAQADQPMTDDVDENGYGSDVTQPTLPAMAARQDQMCQKLDKIMSHLGLDKDDDQGGEAAIAGKGPSSPMPDDSEGFGG